MTAAPTSDAQTAPITAANTAEHSDLTAFSAQLVLDISIFQLSLLLCPLPSSALPRGTTAQKSGDLPARLGVQLRKSQVGDRKPDQHREDPTDHQADLQ